MERRVDPEILDRLPADDPEAVGSRKDLRRINALMGNFGWMRRAMRRLPRRPRTLIEVGAGDGRLLEQVSADVESATGVDLAPRPRGLSDSIAWRQGDVFNELEEGDLLVANLFLHHFDEKQLHDLGKKVREFEAVCISEPWRSRLALAEGYALCPFVNRVTRHDMLVSIRAGFVPGELPDMLGMNEKWEIREDVTGLGACRLLAWKQR